MLRFISPVSLFQYMMRFVVESSTLIHLFDDSFSSAASSSTITSSTRCCSMNELGRSVPTSSSSDFCCVFRLSSSLPPNRRDEVGLLCCFVDTLEVEGLISLPSLEREDPLPESIGLVVSTVLAGSVGLFSVGGCPLSKLEALVLSFALVGISTTLLGVASLMSSGIRSFGILLSGIRNSDDVSSTLPLFILDLSNLLLLDSDFFL
mmetsp:Transcript_28788/g.42952  ORF Transcript_28788/g.42952 Transcript_28788/m.42952 type:complete len:206 (-) Transcript_28788:1151-1768(-)